MKRDKSDNCEPSPFFTGVRPFLLLTLFFSLYLAFKILYPFLNPIILAVILAALFHPLHLRLVKFFRGRKNLAALVSVAAISFVIVIPFFFVTSALVGQSIEFSGSVKSWINQGHLENLQQQEYVAKALKFLESEDSLVNLKDIDLKSDILAVTKRASEFFISQGANLLGNFLSLLASFCIMMFIIFFLLRDGRKMVDSFKHLSPLREDQEDRIIERIRSVSRSALLGGLLTAAAQGVVGGIGLSIAGLPGVFWGAMMAFSSLIPMVGTTLIWIPASLYLLFFDSWGWALFLALWCGLLVGSIDNFLRPVFMKGEGGLSTFYIFLAILGGVQIFGLAGIIYGPLIIGFAMVMLTIYEVEFKDLLHECSGPEAASRRVARDIDRSIE